MWIKPKKQIRLNGYFDVQSGSEAIRTPTEAVIQFAKKKFDIPAEQFGKSETYFYSRFTWTEMEMKYTTDESDVSLNGFDELTRRRKKWECTLIRSITVLWPRKTW